MADTPIPEEIWLEAARFADMDPAGRESCTFGDWVQADYRHVTAFHAISDMLADAALNDALSACAAEAPVARRKICPPPASVTRREIWQWAAAAAVGGLTLWSGHYAWNALTRPQVFETAPGENRMLSLADGTRLYLNGGTKVVLPGRMTGRALTLQQGEAYFAIKHDPAHPFQIHLNRGTVTVLGTEFNISYDGQDIEVDVYKGKVKFSDPKGKSHFLTRGMRSILRGGQLSDTDGFDPNSGDWRSGWIEAHALELAQVTRAFTRYSGVKIIIPDKTLGARKVTGRLRLDHPLNQLKVLSGLYNFRISVADNTITLES